MTNDLLRIAHSSNLLTLPVTKLLLQPTPTQSVANRSTSKSVDLVQQPMVVVSMLEVVLSEVAGADLRTVLVIKVAEAFRKTAVAAHTVLAAEEATLHREDVVKPSQLEFRPKPSHSHFWTYSSITQLPTNVVSRYQGSLFSYVRVIYFLYSHLSQFSLMWFELTEKLI